MPYLQYIPESSHSSTRQIHKNDPGSGLQSDKLINLSHWWFLNSRNVDLLTEIDGYLIIGVRCANSH